MTYTAPTAISVSKPEEQGYAYQAIAASQSDVDLGANANPGDELHLLIINITNASNTLTIKDGATTVLDISNMVGVGLHSIRMDMRAITGWSVTTGTGIAIVAVGSFT